MANPAETSSPDTPSDALLVLGPALPSLVLTVLLTAAALFVLQCCYPVPAAPSGGF